MPTPLEDLAEELHEADRQNRVEMLIDLAKNLPALPEKYERLKDAEHRVVECQSPVFLFVEIQGDKVGLFADAPIEGADGSRIRRALARRTRRGDCSRDRRYP